MNLLYSFVTRALVEDIVAQTNLYAAQYFEKINSTQTWETTAEEITAYLGFIIIMGINRRPELYDYWSDDPAIR